MSEINLPPIPDYWTPAHALAFIYIAFAGFTDGQVDPDEASVIRTKLAEWGVDWDEISSGLESFAGSLSSEQMASCIAAFCAIIAEELPKPQLGAIYRDLVSISKADGKVVDAETRWLDVIKSTFEV